MRAESRAAGERIGHELLHGLYRSNQPNAGAADPISHKAPVHGGCRYRGGDWFGLHSGVPVGGPVRHVGAALAPLAG
eukprot:scaffold884_cov398-Prasinococcus_capsulatus_cf.AAC.30